MLPRQGVSWPKLQVGLRELKSKDFDWKKGRLPSYTYFLDQETLDVQTAAYVEYIGENGLGAGRAFKSLETMTKDVIEMGLSLFHAPARAGGSMTSGGTESVFQAVKTCRNATRQSRSDRYGIYNVVTPCTAHPCLEKAARTLDVEVRRVELDGDGRGDAEAIAQAVDDRTMMIYASAPCYPYGLFDPIARLASLADARGLWLHVDACWGGFYSPFAKKLGAPIPPWDFEVDGVTSVSADIHKFGYAAKGASLILYADAALLEHQEFRFSDWPRGTYATPTFLGTKPGGSIASAWAVMQFLGEDGYLRAAREIMAAMSKLTEGINAIPGLRCIDNKGEGNLLTFVADDDQIDIMAVADCLESHGWFRGRMRTPLGIHQGVTPAHLPVADAYLSALSEAVSAARHAGPFHGYDERSY